MNKGLSIWHFLCSVLRSGSRLPIEGLTIEQLIQVFANVYWVLHLQSMNPFQYVTLNRLARGHSPFSLASPIAGCLDRVIELLKDQQFRFA